MARRLTRGEVELAREVFADAIRLEPVRVHAGGFGGFAVTIGTRLFLPPSMWREDFSAADLASKALFVHELVHVWQFQTRPAWTLGSWAWTLLRGGYGPGLPGYRYRVPLEAFETLGLEQQASVVEHAFVLARGGRPGRGPHPFWLSHLRAAAPFPIGPDQG